MYKNNELFYCYLPTTQKEDIIWVPRQDDEPANLCNLLYEVKKPLGQVLFNLLSRAKDVLVAADIEHTHAISDAVMYNFLDRPERFEINRNPIKPDYVISFLKNCFQKAGTTPIDVDMLEIHIWFMEKFIAPYVDTGKKCMQKEFDKFLLEHHRAKQQAILVQLDLNEYFQVSNTMEATGDALDIIQCSC